MIINHKVAILSTGTADEGGNNDAAGSDAGDEFESDNARFGLFERDLVPF